MSYLQEFKVVSRLETISAFNDDAISYLSMNLIDPFLAKVFNDKIRREMRLLRKIKAQKGHRYLKLAAVHSYLESILLAA